MRKYTAYSKKDIIKLAIKGGLPINYIRTVEQGDSSDVFNLLYNNQEKFISGGMKLEDYFYSQLYWSCRYLYEMSAKSEEAPDFEASIIDILGYLIIVLNELYGEEVDSDQIQNIDRLLEKEFGVKRPGSFIE